MHHSSISDTELDVDREQVRRDKRLTTMCRLVWSARSIAFNERNGPEGKCSEVWCTLKTMLQDHFLEQWFVLSDPSIEYSPNGKQSMRQTSRLSLLCGGVREETSIIDDNSIEATDLNNNASSKRYPEKQQFKNGNDWCYNTKGDVVSGEAPCDVRGVKASSAPKHDMTQSFNLDHGPEKEILGDASDTGFEKRSDARKIESTGRHVSVRRSCNPDAVPHKGGVNLLSPRVIRAGTFVARNCTATQAPVQRLSRLRSRIKVDVTQRFPIRQLRKQRQRILIETREALTFDLPHSDSHSRNNLFAALILMRSVLVGPSNRTFLVPN